MASYSVANPKIKRVMDTLNTELYGEKVAPPLRRSMRIATAEAQRYLDWSRDPRFNDYFREYCGKEAQRMFSELGVRG